MSPRSQLTLKGPDFSRVIAGLWRIGDWNMNAQQRLGFTEQCLELGVTSSGGYLRKLSSGSHVW